MDRPELRARVGLVLGAAASIGAVAAAAVELLALVRQRPVAHAALLLIPAVPLVAAGQLWAILVIRRRVPPGRRGGRVSFRGVPGLGEMRRLAFGSLGTRTAGAIYAVFGLGVVLALIAFPALVHGGPGGHTSTCAYVLSNHGSTRCVSGATYHRAGAAVQRFAAGILLGFFVFHAGVAFGGRRPDPV